MQIDLFLELTISLYVLVLSIFVGFEVIAKVPTMLHTPLMSGSNAISGIIIVGAISAIISPVFVAIIIVSIIVVMLIVIRALQGPYRGPIGAL